MKTIQQTISKLVVIVLGTSAAVLVGAAPAGCSSSVGSYCDKTCDCIGCSQPEHDDCVDNLADGLKAAEEAGCEKEFNDALSCVDSELTCTEGKIDDDGCESESKKLLECNPPVETKNECDLAADDYVAHYESCGNKVADPGEGGSTECTEAEGNTAKCASTCYAATPCDYVNGKGTADEAKSYTDCLSSCSK